MKLKIKTILQWILVCILIVLILDVLINKTEVTIKNRTKGQSTFLYTVEGCNVYRISDGNGDNAALLSKCSHGNTISETKKELDTHPGPGPFQNKEVIVSNTTE